MQLVAKDHGVVDIATIDKNLQVPTGVHFEQALSLPSCPEFGVQCARYRYGRWCARVSVVNAVDDCQIRAVAVPF